MEDKSKKERFLFIQSVYAKMTLVIFAFSIVLLILGYGFVKSITSAPKFIVNLSVVLFYYHIVHFFFGILIVILYLVAIKRRIGKVRIMKVIASIFFTPVSFIFAYIALFLLAVSSCSG